MGQSLNAFPGPATECNVNLLLGTDGEIPAQNLMGLPFRSQSWPKMQVIIFIIQAERFASNKNTILFTQRH